MIDATSHRLVGGYRNRLGHILLPSLVGSLGDDGRRPPPLCARRHRVRVSVSAEGASPMVGDRRWLTRLRGVGAVMKLSSLVVGVKYSVDRQLGLHVS